MSCARLYKGLDITCQTFSKKYYQQVVLINKDDVEDFVISASSPRNTPERYLEPIFSHRIRFSLKENRSGLLFRGNERGLSYFATFSKELDENIPQYVHSVQLPIFGVSEETKIILKTLDYARYFAAIQFMNGTVEIYGFENGLTTDDYDYDPQGNEGGSIITLISPENGMEDEPPFVYVPISGSATEDFDNLFVDIISTDLGSFNNDFNNDFDIT